MKAKIASILLIGVLLSIVGCKKPTYCGDITIAIDCQPISFTENYSNLIKNPSVFFIKAVTSDVEEQNYTYLRYEVIKDLKGNFTHKSHFFYSGSAAPSEIKHSTSEKSNIHESDTFVMLLLKACEISGRDMDDIYTPTGCATTMLKFSNGYVSGHVSHIEKDNKQTMSWNEFQKLLKSTKK